MEPAPKRRRKQKQKQKGVEVDVSTFGGAICYHSSGLLVTTVTALISKLKPHNKLAFDEVLKKLKVMARSWGGLFRDVVFYGENQGLVVYQIRKRHDDEVFQSINLDDIINTELTTLDRVFAFVNSGGNFSFRSGVTNTTQPRVLEVVVNKNDFPCLNPRLPLLQFSNLGKYTESGVSGCAVFKKDESNDFLGLTVFCIEPFMLVMPLSTIRRLLLSIIRQKEEKEEKDDTDKEGGGSREKGKGDEASREKGKCGETSSGKGKGGESSCGKSKGGRHRGGRDRGGKNRSELADFTVDAYSVAALKANLYAFPGIQAMRFIGSQVIMHRGVTIEHEEDNPTNRTLDLTSSPEVGPPTNQGASDATFFGSTHSVLNIDFHLPFESNLQESVATMAHQYVSSVISSVQRVAMAISPSDLTPTVCPKLSLILVHCICNIYSCPGKGFYRKTQTVGRCNSSMDNLTNRTLDFTLNLEVGSPTNQGASDATTSGSTRFVLTIVFQLPFESNLQESDATMARQYVRSVISSVQRVAMAITPSDLTPTVGPKLSPGSLEALPLVHWICKIYSCSGQGFYRKTQAGGRCNTYMALHYRQQIALETSGEVVYSLGKQPAVLRTFSQRLNRRPNDVIDGFSNDGWTLLNCDGTEDVIIACNSAKPFIATLNGANLLPVVVLLCAKASMRLQDNLTNRTVELTLSLELGLPTNQGALEATPSGSTRSVLSNAYQVPFDSNLQESVATMAHQYVRSVISTPAGLTPRVGPELSLGSLKALTLVYWICKSYCCRMGTGTELLQHPLLLIKVIKQY